VDSRTQQLRNRTKDFAIRIIHLFRALPPAKEAQIIGNQLLRCGTAVGANYRSACHARSRADFIAKIGVVTEEADESVFWLAEARQLTAIFNASRQTAKKRR
jgi:four helix bundle protein